MNARALEICSADGQQWDDLPGWAQRAYREQAAEQCAQQDAQSIIRAAMVEPLSLAARTACIVDGTMYSPSWRALAGGAEVWAHDCEGLAAEVYTDELDRRLDDLSAPDGRYLYWEDGALYVSLPELEPMPERVSDPTAEALADRFLLWVNNDESLYIQCGELTREASRGEYPRADLRDSLRDWFEVLYVHDLSDWGSLTLDMLGIVRDSIDWYALAVRLLAEVES